MSMNLWYAQISPELLEKIIANPGLTKAIYEVELRQKMVELQERISGDPLFVEAFSQLNYNFDALALNYSFDQSLIPFSPDEKIYSLQIDTIWHALHFLITGEEKEQGKLPIGKVIMGGTPIGEEVGYGPARYLRPAEVSNVAEALNSISDEELQQRDLTLLEELYGHFSQEELPLLLEVFKDLVKFYQEAADRGNAILIYMT